MRWPSIGMSGHTPKDKDLRFVTFLGAFAIIVVGIGVWMGASKSERTTRTVNVSAQALQPASVAPPNGPAPPMERIPPSAWRAEMGSLTTQNEREITIESSSKYGETNSVARVEYNRDVPPAYEFKVRFERIDQSVETAEVIFLGGHFQLYILGGPKQPRRYGFWIPPAPVEWKSSSAFDERVNEIRLMQQGRRVSVVLNGKQLDEFVLSQDPKPGKIGLFVKGTKGGRSKLKATGMEFRLLQAAPASN